MSDEILQNFILHFLYSCILHKFCSVPFLTEVFVFWGTVFSVVMSLANIVWNILDLARRIETGPGEMMLNNLDLRSVGHVLPDPSLLLWKPVVVDQHVEVRGDVDVGPLLLGDLDKVEVVPVEGAHHLVLLLNLVKHVVPVLVLDGNDYLVIV